MARVEKPFTTGKDMIGKVTRDPADGPAITLLANEHDSCFAAGTLVLTNAGPKSIEQVEPGELVLSFDEHDPNGSAESGNVLNRPTTTPPPSF